MINEITIAGVVTQDVTASTSKSGVQWAKMNVAVNRYVKKKALVNGQPAFDQEVEYFAVSLFGDNAEWGGKKLRKGTKVWVKGRIQSGSYKNNEGVEVKTFDIMPSKIFLVQPLVEKVNTQPQPRPEPQPVQTNNIEEIDPESIPF